MPDYLNRLVNELYNIPPNVLVSSLYMDDDGKYWIRSDGKTFSLVNNKPHYMTFSKNNKGYLYTEIQDKKYSQHRLLAFAFTPDKIKRQFMDYLEVHHLNLDKTDNRLDNLCIVSKAKHKRIHYTWNKLKGWRKIPWEEMEQEQRITQIRELYK